MGNAKFVVLLIGFAASAGLTAVSISEQFHKKADGQQVAAGKDIDRAAQSAADRITKACRESTAPAAGACRSMIAHMGDAGSFTCPHPEHVLRHYGNGDEVQCDCANVNGAAFH